jgi:hypothetical protein
MVYNFILLNGDNLKDFYYPLWERDENVTATIAPANTPRALRRNGITREKAKVSAFPFLRGRGQIDFNMLAAANSWRS